MNSRFISFVLFVLVMGILMSHSARIKNLRKDVSKLEEIVKGGKVAEENKRKKKREKRAAEDKKKKERFPLVAIVLDDFGYTKKNLKTLNDIGTPLTMAILPNAPHSKAVCLFAKENNLEVILHLPMEPSKQKNSLEKNTINVGMDPDTVKTMIANALSSVSPVRGVSNHMGSRATRDRGLMTTVLGDLKERDMFFLDSLTTGKSVCEDVAQEIGVPYAVRNIFIDNKLDKGYIKRQMKKAGRIASSRGSAIAIGHDRKETADALREIVPEMEARGIQFVFLSELIEGSKSKGEKQKE